MKKKTTKKNIAKKTVATRKNKYFYEHVPSFKMNKNEFFAINDAKLILKYL